jgi:hypothetical protein
MGQTEKHSARADVFRSSSKNGRWFSAPQTIARIKHQSELSVSVESANGMVRPCSCPASVLSWQGAPTTKERAMTQTPRTVGIDIGKHSFHVVGHDERGAIVLRQKWSRGQLEARFANMPPCLVGTEACVGAMRSSSWHVSVPTAGRNHCRKAAFCSASYDGIATELRLVST